MSFRSRARLSAALTAAIGLSVPATAPLVAQPLFEELAEAAGLRFRHFNGMSGEYYLIEVMGPGVGLLDHDGDGDLDVYFRQGTMLGDGKTLADALAPPPGGAAELGDRLFRNDQAAGPAGMPAFVDVSSRAGLVEGPYGMGVAVGDYDADGLPDLYLTNWGPNLLLRNRGDGTFEDTTAVSGVGDAGWGVAATFFDFDRDALLDLYVGNYLDVGSSFERQCTTSTGGRDYCAPLAYRPQGDRIFRNLGNGRFEDWSVRTGLAAGTGAALGAVAADFDGDGWSDLYVGNDMTANQLWINRGDGTFSDEGLFSGSAVNWEGKPEASMGIDAADFDGDGDEDLFLVHLTGETNTLYENDGRGIFRDRTVASGLGSPSWNYTSFGTAWIDVDNDGLLDLLVVNGAVRTIEELAARGDPFPLHQPNQIFLNRGDGRFEEVSSRAGPAFELSEVSRGAAFGDLDEDGDADVVVANNNGPARLLMNRRADGSRWVGVRLTGSAPALRAVITVDEKTFSRRFRTDGSYASAHDPRALIGLGEATVPESLEVTWADGRRVRLRTPPVRHYLVFDGDRGAP